MPYLPKSDIKDLEKKDTIVKAGELNYMVSTMINNYFKKHGLNYSNLNEMIGALECAKLELYRRVGAPYEDFKLKENGDVYTSTMEEIKEMPFKNKKY